MSRRPAIFLDRDGTLIVDKHFLSDPDDIELFPETVPALKRLSEMGFALVIISNQSGVARGYFDETQVEKVNKRLLSLLGASEVRIDGVYYCPNHPNGVEARFRQNLQCRKPNTGMVDRAVSDLDIDLSGSWVVGDKISDIDLADNLGIPGILVQTGYGKRYECVNKASNLLEVVNIIEKGSILS